MMKRRHSGMQGPEIERFGGIGDLGSAGAHGFCWPNNYG